MIWPSSNQHRVVGDGDRRRQSHGRGPLVHAPVDGRAAPDDIRPCLIAEAVITVHRESVGAIRRALLADLPDAKVTARALRIARAAFTLLTGGLGGYATKPAAAPEPAASPA